MKQIFKVSDWCFCEFTLKQVIKTSGNKVTEVSDGRMSHSSPDLSDRCYPLEMKYKRVSDSVEYYHDKFHRLNIPGFNHPDFMRELVSRWVSLCESVDDVELTRKRYEELQQFCTQIERTVTSQREELVSGFRLYR